MEGKENDAAASRAWQIRKEKANLEQDYNTVGYYTFTVVLKGENKAEVEKRALLVKTILNAKGFTAKIENFNALEAYLSTMPGNLLNVRKPLQNSLVFGNLLPLNAVWAGDAWNKHLNTPPLLYCQTIGNTPFRLNLHFGDVGHTIIIGPTGAGKSVLLDRKSTRLNSSHANISYAVFCLKKKKRTMLNLLNNFNNSFNTSLTLPTTTFTSIIYNHPILLSYLSCTSQTS